jgi:hypothetical protein
VLNTSRVDQVFKQFASVKDAYVGATSFVAALGCSEVGLETGLEYPVWVLLQRPSHPPLRIDHAFVTNLSAARSKASPFARRSPCAVLVDSNCGPPCSPREADKESLFAGSAFTKAWSSGRVAVFVDRDASNPAERMRGPGVEDDPRHGATSGVSSWWRAAEHPAHVWSP